MDTVTVITNNVPREIIDAWELTPKEREEFDYLDWKEIEVGNTSRSFFRYKGELYDLDDFMLVPDGLLRQMKFWDGYISDTFFSGILIKWGADNESVIVGRYYA